MNKKSRDEIHKEDISTYIHKRKHERLGKICAALIISVAFVFIICIFKLFYYSSKYSEIYSIENKNDYKYAGFDNGIIEYNKNSISLKVDDDIKWQYEDRFTNPTIVTKDKYGVLYEKGGTRFLTLSKKEVSKPINIHKNILKVQTLDTGDNVILSKAKGVYYLEIYDSMGQVLLTISSTLNSNGIPVDFYMNNTDKKIYVCYISVNNKGNSSSIIGYDVSDPSIEDSERIIRSVKFDEEVCSAIEPVSDDKVAVIGSKAYYIYDLSNNNEEYSTFKYTSFSEYAFARKNAIVQVGNDSGESFISIYDENAFVRLYKNIKQVYNKLYVSTDKVIFVDNKNMTGYAFNGKKIFSYQFEQNIKDVVLNEDGTYVVTLNDKILMIR